MPLRGVLKFVQFLLYTLYLIKKVKQTSLEIVNKSAILIEKAKGLFICSRAGPVSEINFCLRL